jgi:hypothetical protein
MRGKRYRDRQKEEGKHTEIGRHVKKKTMWIKPEGCTNARGICEREKWKTEGEEEEDDDDEEESSTYWIRIETRNRDKDAEEAMAMAMAMKIF